MKVAVIIPCYNSAKNIVYALDSLLAQSVLPDEVILVDNGSTDDTVEIINKFKQGHAGLNLIFTSELKKGAAAARNKGIKISGADAAAFMDSDCIADKDWIKNIRELYNDEFLCAIGGQTMIYEPVNSVEKLQAIDELKSEKPSAGKERRSSFLLGRFPVTNNASYRMGVLRMVEGFDESFLVGEDADLFIRVIKKIDSSAKVIILQPQVKMWHKPRNDFRQLTRQVFFYRLALARLVKAHFRKEVIIKIPFLGMFEYSGFPAAIWIDSPILVLLGFLGLCIILRRAVFYMILLGVSAFLFNIYKRTRKAGLKEAFFGVISIALVSLGKKIVSELAKIYGCIKYRVVCI